MKSIFLSLAILAAATPAAVSARWIMGTTERIQREQQRGIEAGTDQAVKAGTEALSFCARIGRQTKQEEIELDVDSSYDVESSSRRGRGSIFIGGGLPSREIRAESSVQGRTSVTCGK